MILMISESFTCGWFEIRPSMKWVFVNCKNSKAVVLRLDACPLVHTDASGGCATTIASDLKLAHPVDKRDYLSPHTERDVGPRVQWPREPGDWMDAFACGEV
jgi:hypothetical protein